MNRAILLLALPLAACSPGSDTAGGNDAAANISLSAGADGGRAEIKGPGIEGSIRLPKIEIAAADFDVNGVKLYPGSTIHDFNLKATDSKNDSDQARLTIGFESPASLEKVQDWFRTNMAERGFKVQPDGQGFSGITDDGDPILVELSAVGSDKVRGTMSVGA